MAVRSAIRPAPAAVADGHARGATGGRPAGDLGDRAGVAERVSVARCAARLWAVQDPVQPVRALGAEGCLGARVRGACGGRRPARDADAGCDPRQGASVGGGRKRGAQQQAIGRSRGGRTTKIHAAVDEAGRPRRLIVRPGHRGDAPVGAALVADLRPARCLADTAYDSDALRAWLRHRGCQPVIPNHPPRKRQHPFDKTAYRARNVIERTFCRLKDWRRVATRYDKLAHNYLASVALAAIVIYWL